MSTKSSKTKSGKIKIKAIKIKPTHTKSDKTDKTKAITKNQQYLNTLSPKENHALKIAQEHLGSSFNLEKSIGFQKWIKKNTQ
jgi:hypothetical protein